jgi:DNA-binding GntR family transcriptional regulator
VAEPTPSVPRTPPGPRPVAKQSIVDLVIEQVRRSILDGSLQPGSQVSIADLSAQMNVSHIPVREALRRLEGEGLVELRRGRSAVIAPLSGEDLADVFGMRALVEAELMAEAAKRYGAEDVAAIEAAYERLGVRPGDDPESLSSRHVEFHRLLVEPAATEWSRRLLDMLWQAGERYMFLVLAESLVGSPTYFRDEHAGLLEAVRQRSPRAARRAVREHLEGGVELIGSTLARASRDAPV